MKHIIQFSGGAASSFVAKYVADEYGRENCILLFNDTKAECKDSYRFRKQVSEYIGMEITEVSDGRDLWQVIEDNNCLPSDRFPFCTRILKQEPSEKFLKNFKEDYILYNGFGVEEWRRIQRSRARAESLNRVVKSPLYDLGISSDEIKRIIREDWKICLPEAYRYLSHNNCIPCFKAGKGHFKAVAKYYPEEYQKAIEAEEKIGYTVFEDITLKQLRKQAFSNLDLFDVQESIPCMCAE
jgi:3'-phosphoadenosine 5'-phosphosulfate sulfotransferase (PAPS reductase)/FAD synthetase